MSEAISLPPLLDRAVQPDRMFRIPVLRAHVRKSILSKIHVQVPITELYVLDNMYGDGAVQVLDGGRPVAYMETTFEREHARLQQKFSLNPNTNMTRVEETYGGYQTSQMRQLMTEHHSLDPVPGPQIEEERKAVATELSGEMPNLDVENAESDVEAEDDPVFNTKKQCIDYLVARNVQFSPTARRATLRVLAHNVLELEQHGVPIQAGWDAEDVERALEAAEGAASGSLDEVENAQTLLEQAAGQTIPQE